MLIDNDKCKVELHGLVVRVIGKGVGVFLGIGEIDALAVDDDPRKLSSVRIRLEGYGDFLAILKVAGEAAGEFRDLVFFAVYEHFDVLAE